MPKGTVHRETGILRRAPIGYALEMDGGGRWLLDIKGSARKLIGKRVTVEGRRMGFDLIYVDEIWCDGKLLPNSLKGRIGGWLSNSAIFSYFVLTILTVIYLD